jgi:glycosyltransferase involved in cell wall biosynthesis
MTVGIMPLEESLSARGKCSFKMLTYMACEVPVVVSPVGMNGEVLSLGCSGLAAETEQQWAEALAFLLDHPGERRAMGRIGRHVVDTHYSTRVLAPRLASILKSLAG